MALNRSFVAWFTHNNTLEYFSEDDSNWNDDWCCSKILNFRNYLHRPGWISSHAKIWSANARMEYSTGNYREKCDLSQFGFVFHTRFLAAVMLCSVPYFMRSKKLVTNLSKWFIGNETHVSDTLPGKDFILGISFSFVALFCFVCSLLFFNVKTLCLR